MKTLCASDFRLASCQATLFTPSEEVSAARIVRDLLPKWSNQFDGEPTIIPTVEGMPAEAPRIILFSKSREWCCEIASARINLFWRKVSKRSVLPSLSSFYGDAVRLLTEYIDVARPRVGRLAAVLNLFAAHDSPGVFLAGHFCKERWQPAPLNRPESFELHTHKKFPLGGIFTVNSWVRSKTGTITEDNQNQPIVLVLQDLNTLAEEIGSRSYSQEQFQNFFELGAEEFGNILSLYYPEEA